MRRYIVVIFCIFPVVVEAMVFKCEKLNETVSYQDLPCSDVNQKQTVLQLCSNNTNISNSINTKYLAMIEKENKKQTKKVKSIQKISKTKHKKALTKKKRCANAKSNIENIQSKLRSGYTVKQGIKLNERLSHYYALERQYCGINQR